MLCLIFSPETGQKNCGRSKKCSKLKGHTGKCDSKREFHEFWKTSRVYNINKKLGSLHESFEELHFKEEAILQKEQRAVALQRETEERLKETGLLLNVYGALENITIIYRLD